MFPPQQPQGQIDPMLLQMLMARGGAPPGAGGGEIPPELMGSSAGAIRSPMPGSLGPGGMPAEMPGQGPEGLPGQEGEQMDPRLMFLLMMMMQAQGKKAVAKRKGSRNRRGNVASVQAAGQISKTAQNPNTAIFTKRVKERHAKRVGRTLGHAGKSGSAGVTKTYG